MYQGQGTGGDQASGPESGTRARGIKVGANLGGEALSGVGKLWEMGDQGGTKVGPRDQGGTKGGSKTRSLADERGRGPKGSKVGTKARSQAGERGRNPCRGLESYGK